MRTLGTRPSLPRVRLEAAAASPIQRRPHHRQLLCIPLAVQSDAVMSLNLEAFNEGKNWDMVLPPNKGLGFEGAVGMWQRYSPEGDLLVSYHGARLFDTPKDGVINQINIYSTQRPGSEARDQDGNVQKEWSYSQAEHSKPDGWWHPFMIADGPMRSRALATSPGRVSSACFALPLPEHVSQHDPPPPFFGSELFFRAPVTGPAWWSGGPLFDVKTGKVMCVFFIREYHVAIEDPTQPLNLAEHPAIQEPRGLLPTDPTEWLSGEWKGVQEALVWEEGNEVPQVSAERPTQWAPPPTDQNVTLLPDLFYAAYPMSVPTDAQEVPADGTSFQMGGLVADGIFMRTVVSYGPAGRLATIQHERFDRVA